ncbi:hypothetical protein AB5N19_04453 [Seiridium cardinale]|uniref:Uncharacterized protein n=1 Tax=Seiridium cardinale TaxID=138064 RepID=A0ABR2XVL5_9PEZI
MYIPQVRSLQPDHVQPPQWTIGPGRNVSYGSLRQVNFRNSWAYLVHELGQRSSILATRNAAHGPRPQKRTTSHDVDTTIGVVVGVLLAVFIIASCLFLYYYRGSIRVKKRRRQRHHRKSSSSKSSKASDGGGSAPAPAPAAPPPA